MEKRSDGHQGFYLFILVVIAIFAIAKYVISDRPERNTSEVKIPPAELNTLQVKAKIAAVLDMAEKMNMKEACQLLSKVSKTKGASWLSGEHYIGDSSQFIKVNPKE
ncbi:MAG: hypothetical protein LBQ22_04950 [Bacteroidales bacterium]|nr:hypothetical protein [Bacteroidales bacterium]